MKLCDVCQKGEMQSDPRDARSEVIECKLVLSRLRPLHVQEAEGGKRLEYSVHMDMHAVCAEHFARDLAAFMATRLRVTLGGFRK